MRWYKDSVLVDYSGRNFFSPNTKSLIIRQIRQEDNGRYTCEVSNVAGGVSHSANLTVLNEVAAGKYVCNCERTKLNVVCYWSPKIGLLTTRPRCTPYRNVCLVC